jgi:hypothetical protein
MRKRRYGRNRVCEAAPQCGLPQTPFLCSGAFGGTRSSRRRPPRLAEVSLSPEPRRWQRRLPDPWRSEVVPDIGVVDVDGPQGPLPVRAEHRKPLAEQLALSGIWSGAHHGMAQSRRIIFRVVCSNSKAVGQTEAFHFGSPGGRRAVEAGMTSTGRDGQCPRLCLLSHREVGLTEAHNTLTPMRAFNGRRACNLPASSRALPRRRAAARISVKDPG